MMKLIEPVIEKEEKDAVIEVLNSGWISEGPVTLRLEEEIKRFVGTRFATATTSCTSALLLCLKALGIGKRDEVIIPDFTHPATGNIVKWLGAEPVLVDVEKDSYNIDYAQAEKAITKKTRCMIPVSWAGNPLDMPRLCEINETHDNLFSIVEDAACSLGSVFNGVKTGKLADVTCFSFHPRKVITTGEGGVVVTDEQPIARRVKLLKFFGSLKKGNEYEFVDDGINCKLSDVLSAIGLQQMRKIDTILQKRVEMAKYYDELLQDVFCVVTPSRRSNTYHTYQTYAVYITKENQRDKVILRLKGKNIETQIGTYALHLQPYYAKTKRVGSLHNSELLYKNLLALPMSYKMTREDQEHVVEQLKIALRG